MQKLVLTILISAAMGYFAAGCVSLQFLWGYEITSEIFGLSTSFWDQMFSTIFIEVFDIAFVATALYFGLVKAYFKGPNSWRYFATLSYALVLTLYCLPFVPWSLSGIQDSATTIYSEFASGWTGGLILNAIILLALKICLFFGVIVGGEFVFESLKLRNRPMVLLLPGFLAIVFPGLLSFFVALNWEMSVLLNFLCIAIASLVAVYNCRFQEYSRSLSVVFFTTLPNTVLNITAVICACMVSGHILLPSVSSALLITGATFIASICGAMVGTLALKSHHPNPNFVESADDCV